ncbi:3D domain-containing protein [Ornithinibacillus halotolerans]|uniref:Peptidase M23 n=1 Tax=Ornithinibacillus halotolerans TaxID=1274357 RepID=A0A916RNZ5_9BACI|nr:3D domain-containing protein [Ornithinibacillus halotolerans]GGA63455.1 peptidase M23 [Ornithinibacillus halotolerans]
MKKTIITLTTVIALAFPLSTSALSYDVLNGETLLGVSEEYQNYEHTNSNQNGNVSEPYIVKKGDTLYAISKQYDISVDELKAWNNLTSDLILVGQELVVEELSAETNKINAEDTIQPKEVKASSTTNVEGKTLTVVATAYTAECDGCTGITYTGINLLENRNLKVIAVDPTIIPLGSKVYVEGYGEAIAGDIGSAIKGNRIDVHLPTKKEAYEWGVKEVKITIVE